MLYMCLHSLFTTLSLSLPLSLPLFHSLTLSLSLSTLTMKHHLIILKQQQQMGKSRGCLLVPTSHSLDEGSEGLTALLGEPGNVLLDKGAHEFTS
jgi:hypothetical protein